MTQSIEVTIENLLFAYEGAFNGRSRPVFASALEVDVKFVILDIDDGVVIAVPISKDGVCEEHFLSDEFRDNECRYIVDESGDRPLIDGVSGDYRIDPESIISIEDAVRSGFLRKKNVKRINSIHNLYQSFKGFQKQEKATDKELSIGRSHYIVTTAAELEKAGLPQDLAYNIIFMLEAEGFNPSLLSTISEAALSLQSKMKFSDLWFDKTPVV